MLFTAESETRTIEHDGKALLLVAVYGGPDGRSPVAVLEPTRDRARRLLKRLEQVRALVQFDGTLIEMTWPGDGDVQFYEVAIGQGRYGYFNEVPVPTFDDQWRMQTTPPSCIVTRHGVRFEANWLGERIETHELARATLRELAGEC